MNRIITGRVLIALSLTLGTIVTTTIDNLPPPIGHMRAVDTWPPHALFHDAVMFLLLDGVALIGLWLLFRRSREPLVGARVSMLIVAAFWTPFFYITTLYPQASLVPTSPVGMPYTLSNFAQWDPAMRKMTPVVLGVPVHVNALVGLGWMCIAAMGYWLVRSGIKEGAHDPQWVP